MKILISNSGVNKGLIDNNKKQAHELIFLMKQGLSSQNYHKSLKQVSTIFQKEVPQKLE